jgi:hypothetical protein
MFSQSLARLGHLLTDPITLTVQEKLNVTLKRDGGVSNFDVQGQLSLQILNQEDGQIQVQVFCILTLSISTSMCVHWTTALPISL